MCIDNIVYTTLLKPVFFSSSNAEHFTQLTPTLQMGKAAEYHNFWCFSRVQMLKANTHLSWHKHVMLPIHLHLCGWLGVKSQLSIYPNSPKLPTGTLTSNIHTPTMLRPLCLGLQLKLVPKTFGVEETWIWLWTGLCDPSSPKKLGSGQN